MMYVNPILCDHLRDRIPELWEGAPENQDRLYEAAGHDHILDLIGMFAELIPMTDDAPATIARFKEWLATGEHFQYPETARLAATML